MQFGRIEGFVTLKPEGVRWLTVILDTGREAVTIRDEAVLAGFEDQDPSWLADQLVQETLGIELAEQGWEIVGEAQGSRNDEMIADDMAWSPAYVIRRA